ARVAGRRREAQCRRMGTWRTIAGGGGMRHFDVLIVGGGFGGATVARHLQDLLQSRRRPGGPRVLLVSPENFLLFAPLLPEAASGTIEPRHAVIPLREMLRRTQLLIGEVTSIDLDARTAVAEDLTGERHELSWGQIVLSPGSVPNVIDIPGLAENAVGFKTLPDAIWLRNRVLRQLEAADATLDPARRRELLTFTFVGGGYAGVEALAEMESLVRDALPTYPGLSRHDLRWVLVEARDSLLPGLDPKLARYSEDNLRRRGVEVQLETRLESCVDKKVVLSGHGVQPYVSETIVWATGQRPSPLVSSLGLPTDEAGRLMVDDQLRAPGRPDVFALGDAAAVPDPDGGICPPTAQHAVRQAKVCAQNAAAVLGVGEATAFRYRNRGLAVTLGRNQGTAQVYRLTFTGAMAWFMGRSYHLIMMPGLARKVRVVADWTMAMLFPRDLSQLGALGRRVPLTGEGPASPTSG
ncbi:MAG: NAD(P)/FAD-dependent oxidoreductase, partial [Actinomycetota bacterium]|nr:NAD(P)/FAD-dependent oxidoreductase [Actinomycetota bacterium]